MEYRVVYNTVEVLAVGANDGCIYTADNIVIGDLKQCKSILDKLGVDTNKINEFVYTDPLNYKYFLIPTELVGYIKHYAGFVKDAYPELMFNVILSSEDMQVENKTIKVVTNLLSVIPCACTHWTEEGLMVLEAVIGSWNNQNPNKSINFSVAFESFNEMIAFRDSNS